MRAVPALLALALLAAPPAAAQRVPAAALLALVLASPRDTAGAGRARTSFDSLPTATGDGRRALWAAGGALAGLAVGGAAGTLLVRGDHRPADQRELDYVGVVALAAVGETIGVTIAAAVPGGRSHGSCRGDVRLLRSFVGTVAGTAAVGLLASRGPAAAYLALPAGQVAGAVLALGGC